MNILLPSLAALLALAYPASAAFNVSGAPPLFPGENIQLNIERFANASHISRNQSIIRLFEFGSESKVPINHGTSDCRLLPGDAAWPSSSTWDVFNFLLGGSLIKTSPLAAVCYSSWPEYSPDKCEEIAKEWLTSDLQ